MGMLDKSRETTEGADVDTPETDPAEESMQVGGPGEAAPEQDADGGRDATPEEQQSYLDALSVLYAVLYVNEETTYAVLNHLLPEDKVGSMSKAASILVQQVGTKTAMSPEVATQLAQDAIDRLVEMFERVKKVEVTDEEAEQALTATQEAVSGMTHAGSPEGPEAALTGEAEAESSEPPMTEEEPTAEAAPETAPEEPING